MLARQLPEGVRQASSTASGERGAALVAGAGLRALRSPARSAIGRRSPQQLAARGIAAQCEMGGQNASIVLADADVEAAAAMIASARDGLCRPEVHRHRPRGV